MFLLCLRQAPILLEAVAARTRVYSRPFPCVASRSHQQVRRVRYPMRLKLITCEVFYREFNAVVARSPHIVDVEFFKGLHDIGTAGMQERLQGPLTA